MTSSTAAPLVRATCPKCQTPDLIVNPSGSLRKHVCEPADAPPAAEEEAPADVAPDAVAPDGAGGASSFGEDVTAAGGAAPAEAAPDAAPETDAPAPPAERAEGRRYCRRENCGKRPVRHGWCAQDHATHCKGR